MIGIIGAMEEEIVLLRGAMAAERVAAERAESTAGFVFYSGEIEGRPVVLLRCGIGKVNAAVGCALLIDRYHPDLVINTGSAGGIDPRLGFGDVVIADALVYHDVDVTAFGYAFGQVPGQAAVFPVPEDLVCRAEGAVDLLRAAGRLPATLNHTRGLIGSGDAFMHDPDQIAALRARFPALAAVEMEGAAIAHTCALFQVPVLVIRALSDIAGRESPLKFDAFLPIAARHSGEITRRIIKES